MSVETWACPGGAGIPLFKRLAKILVRMTIAAGFMSLTPLLQSWSWILEDIAAFRVLWVVTSVVATVLAFASGRRIVAILCLACAVVNGAGLREPSAGNDVAAGARATTIRLLHHNVHFDRGDVTAVIDHIESASPDVVVLLEVDAAWLRALEPVLQKHRHRLKRPRGDTFGLAVYSRLPARFEKIDFGLEPGVVGTVEIGGRSVRLAAFHGMPPVWELRERRNDSIAALSAHLRSNSGATIVSGDFNAAPWSPAMRTFRDETGLAPIAVGLAAPPTWPAPLPRFMRVPIDQVLVSADLEIRAAVTGPHCGSDHLPLVVDIAVPRGAAPNPSDR